ncbi:uncharacterized protein LOC143365897 [Halictus rubicundus]|uniref:uncharacterized protein LOC143365897 n=1 Tax=Halictus rubicundus TaxID=77578 RepID=UPI0040371843
MIRLLAQPEKESPEAGPCSSKQRHSASDKDDIVLKRLCKDVNTNQNEEFKFAKSVAGKEGTPRFNMFLDFLLIGEGKKCLVVLKREGVNLTNMSSILGKAGANASQAFNNLYDLWFDTQGNGTKYLKTLEENGVNLSNMSSILSKAGTNASEAFKVLYDLWFGKQGNKTQYLKTLKQEGINLVNISSILSRAGANAPKAFKNLYNLWFDARENKTQYLKHFIEKKDGERNFTLYNLSGILTKAGAKAKHAFKKLHNICFNDVGERTELLDDFYRGGFTPSNLSSALRGTGTRASSILKRLHSVCFNEKREILLNDFYKMQADAQNSYSVGVCENPKYRKPDGWGESGKGVSLMRYVQFIWYGPEVARELGPSRRAIHADANPELGHLFDLEESFGNGDFL